MPSCSTTATRRAKSKGSSDPSPHARSYAFDVSEDSDFELDAASLRADSVDLRISIEVLASKLEQALPSRTRVQRSGGGLLRKGAKRVCEVLVQLGDMSYRLQVEGERLQGSRQKEVGGIAIKREDIEPHLWVAELTDTLRAEAQSSAEARQALEQLIA